MVQWITRWLNRPHAIGQSSSWMISNMEQHQKPTIIWDCIIHISRSFHRRTTGCLENTYCKTSYQNRNYLHFVGQQNKLQARQGWLFKEAMFICLTDQNLNGAVLTQFHFCLAITDYYHVKSFIYTNRSGFRMVTSIRIIWLLDRSIKILQCIYKDSLININSSKNIRYR